VFAVQVDTTKSVPTTLLRCQTLACGDAEDEERDALKAVTARLLKVRVEKLGYPLTAELLQNIERDLLS
jgi:hypothetical protein